MKKLMIAAAIVCAAVISQGAALTWKWTSTLYDAPNKGASDVAYQGTVYLFNANEVTQQAILDASGDLTKFSEMASRATTDGKGATSLTIADPTSSYTGKTREDGGSTYIDYFYAAITTDESGNDYVFLSETKSMQVQSAKDTALGVSLSASKSIIDGSTYTAQGWYQTVPEPTSGLLLLLGIAGLALKRKRA